MFSSIFQSLSTMTSPTISATPETRVTETNVGGFEGLESPPSSRDDLRQQLASKTYVPDEITIEKVDEVLYDVASNLKDSGLIGDTQEANLMAADIQIVDALEGSDTGFEFSKNPDGSYVLTVSREEWGAATANGNLSASYEEMYTPLLNAWINRPREGCVPSPETACA